jgi:hypothetical protein
MRERRFAQSTWWGTLRERDPFEELGVVERSEMAIN